MAEQTDSGKIRFSAVGLIGRPGTQVADSLLAVIDCLAERDLRTVIERRTAGMLSGGDHEVAGTYRVGQLLRSDCRGGR